MRESIGTHRLTARKAIGRIKEEEAARDSFVRGARNKFIGSAVCAGMAAGGAVLVAAHGKVGDPAAAWAAGEALLTGGTVGLFGWGLHDKSQAEDSSWKSAALLRALAQEEISANMFIGPMLHDEPEPGEEA